jgi:two-component system, NarL family, sensor histidine kinase UhpB
MPRKTVTTPVIKILHLEDDPFDADLIKAALDQEGIPSEIVLVGSRSDYMQAVENGSFDIILSDYSLPGFDGLSALAVSTSRHPDVPFIFVSGKMGEELAIETLKSGATDYVLKDRLYRLGPSVKRALKEASERSGRRRAVEELEKSHKQMRSLAAHLQSVREEERLKIAREIHDELGQILTLLKFDLEYIRDALTDDQNKIRDKIESDRDLVMDSISSVKRICNELRPGLLDHLGIEAALEWQAEEFQRRTGIACAVDLPQDSIDVDIDRATALFRIFQEALTNVIKHSEATKVMVKLTDQAAAITLDISDNGTGISKEQLNKSNSFGLLGMRERVHIWNGEVRINGGKNTGASIKVIIPKELG